MTRFSGACLLEDSSDTEASVRISLIARKPHDRTGLIERTRKRNQSAHKSAQLPAKRNRLILVEWPGNKDFRVLIST